MRGTIAHNSREVCVFLTKDTRISATVEKIQEIFMSTIGHMPLQWSYDLKHGTHHMKFGIGANEKPWQTTKKVHDALKRLGISAIARTN